KVAYNQVKALSDRRQLDEWLAVLPRLEEAERAGVSVAHLDNDKVYDLIGLVRVREQLALARRLGIID
ncbi:MAG TPA: hypothetical protein PLV68_17870, partial [Ilumatobacteraceae bacterium]|nr:hypothetical protein [Ilumatobacteraceae bacterium]